MNVKELRIWASREMTVTNIKIDYTTGDTNVIVKNEVGDLNTIVFGGGHGVPIALGGKFKVTPRVEVERN